MRAIRVLPFKPSTPQEERRDGSLSDDVALEELIEVMRAWPELAPDIRQAIVRVVRGTAAAETLARQGGKS
jgi:hypothetical protein